MKYTYAYKTSDGVRHEDSMESESREAVFAALRAKGIKAIKVVAADGSKANGEIRGVRKRIVTLIAVSAAAVVGIAAFFVGGSRPMRDQNTLTSSPRHQIYGDPVVTERFERGDFNGVFSREGDVLLAMFAEPGKFLCPKGANPLKLSPEQLKVFSDYVQEELEIEKDVVINSDDAREICELKQIVNGMRQELRDYLANGNGTPNSFWRRLNQRTFEEMRVYERVRRELENEKNEAVFEEKNRALRRIGLRTIPFKIEE